MKAFPSCVSCTALLLVFIWACGSESPDSLPSPGVAMDSGFAAVADSEWVDVTGVALIGFYPVRTNEQLERDEGLAGALDNFSYYIGNAMDSLTAAGAAVHYRGGDTLWLRAGARRWRFVRDADSSEIGYLFTDTLRRAVPVYGVQGSVELTAYVHEFRQTGRVTRQ